MYLLQTFLLCIVSVEAAVRKFNWTVGWTKANPDGEKLREVVAINGIWPPPIVRVDMGDRIELCVNNQMYSPRRNNSIHFHGMFQNGTNDMDGAVWLNQGPIPPGSSFLYNFTVNQTGTYWYHTHTDALYPDGYRQIFLVDNDNAWFRDQVDREIPLTLQDWYHELTQDLTEGEQLTIYNPTGAEPQPDSNLMNNTLNPIWEVQANETVQLRIANTAAFTAYTLYIEGTEFDIVEVDGVYTEPARTQSIYVGVGQRYSLLFNTSEDANKVYRIISVADSSLYDVIPSETNLNTTGFFYQGDKSELIFNNVTNAEIYRSGLVNTSEVSIDDFDSEDVAWFDDMDLVPWDHEPKLPKPDKEINATMMLTNLKNGINYAFINDISWTHAKVPTLYSVLSAPDDVIATNYSVYGEDTHSIILNHLDVVQLVLNNDDTGKHPFHLHGHNFQCLLRGKNYGEDDDTQFTPYDPHSSDNKPFPDIPMRRDTLVIQPNSHFVIRWRADNPGVWFFHCHIDWHLSQGLALEFIEAPVQIRQNYKVHSIPEINLAACAAANVSTVGNGASHVNSSFTDISGMNVQQPWLPSNFTARGIVALVFSILCALISLGFITWYGLSDTKAGEARTASHILERNFENQNVNPVQSDMLS